MHKNPSERIKLHNIKDHAWFALYKVSFLEVPPELAARQSNLLTDSMIADGEDPFEDFMNKRLKGSHSSEGQSLDGSSSGISRDSGKFSSSSGVDDQNASLSFKKQDRSSDLTKNIANDPFNGLEIIPEEKMVQFIHYSQEILMI